MMSKKFAADTNIIAESPPSTPRRWTARSRELLSAPHHFEFGVVIFLYVILKLFTLSRIAVFWLSIKTANDVGDCLGAEF